MKTLTTTFHASVNTGSFLQAYALQRTIVEKLKIENKIIDFQTQNQKNLYRIFKPNKNLSSIARNIFTILHLKKLKKRHLRYEEMRNQFLDMTEEVSTEEEVYSIAKNADINIVGSDQIWNTKIADFSPAYFMPNINTKKIAYAVSAGPYASKNIEEKYYDDIRCFSAVSAREKSMLEAISAIRNDATVVLDPTCLLNKEEYYPLFEKERKIKGDYILLYTINNNEEILKTAKKLSKELGIKVVAPFSNYGSLKALKYGIKLVYDASPDVFLNLFYNAKTVLTNSFHGTAFSVIFRKDFYRVAKEENGAFVKDARIDDFLDSIDLNRTISFNTDVGYIKQNMNADYKEAEKKLNELKEKSLNYLRESLKN